MKHETIEQPAEERPGIWLGSELSKVYCANCHLATPNGNVRCIHCGRKMSVPGLPDPETPRNCKLRKLRTICE